MIKIRVYMSKRAYKALSFLPLLSMSIVMQCTFLAAYFNGGQVLVTINNFNEASIELVVIPLTILLCIYWFKKSL